MVLHLLRGALPPPARRYRMPFGVKEFQSSCPIRNRMATSPLIWRSTGQLGPVRAVSPGISNSALRVIRSAIGQRFFRGQEQGEDTQERGTRAANSEEET